MEQLENTIGMLELMVRPAFCVQDGIITGANQEAHRHLIPVGAPIVGLLPQNKEEYDAFQGGCLYLTLQLHNSSFGVSVTRQAGCDIFVLEQEEDQGELNAMALAAQELREPLANVMTVADRLFPSAGVDPSQQDQIAHINRGLFQMLRIISNMSDAARYQQESHYNFELRDVTAILEEIFQKAGDLLRQTGIQVTFRNWNDRVYTLVDSEKLERAVYNILSNAAKFTPKGGSIDARLSRRGSKLYLTVQDSGSGVESALRGSLHARYLRQPGIEDGRFGIGLGMVLIRSTAAAHGGTVLLEHPEGLGTRITMTMAIRQPKDSSFRSDILHMDYAGERDHGLIELSEILPAQFYESDAIN